MAIPTGNEFLIGIICTSLTIYFPTKSLPKGVTVTTCMSGPKGSVLSLTFTSSWFWNLPVFSESDALCVTLLQSVEVLVVLLLWLSTDKFTLSEDRNKCV